MKFRNFKMVDYVVYGRGCFDQVDEIIAPHRKGDAPMVFLLDHYFENVIHADESGYMKPDKRMFDYALQTAGIQTHQCIMIGDDLYADVLGAKNVGMDHVFVNRLGTKHIELLTYEIDCLSTLKTFL